MLFLEPEEYIPPGDLKRLAKFLQNSAGQAATIAVERRLTPGTLTNYAWVTTAEALKNPGAEMDKYFTSETRLISISALAKEGALKISAGRNDAAFTLEVPPDTMVLEAPITARRENAASAPSAAEERPADWEIFRRGHQRLFDDSVYSASFVWPHTVYHTIRYDHVGSIIAALKSNLSSPEIIMYTLVYLLKFRHFSKAAEILTLIPERWYVRYPDLANAAAAIYHINGHYEKAMGLYWKVLDIDPDSTTIACNAVKLSILAESYDAIPAVIDRYREGTGKELENDYLKLFKEAHGGYPERTARLSVCMIVRDEEKTIERAIASVRPVADEIIVVDTGSADRTVSIAEGLGADIHHFPWCDDFAAARNFAIGKAKGDYIFMLDADEYISPFFYIESQTLKKLFPLKTRPAYQLSIGSYFNETDWLFLTREEGNFRFESTALRIFPNLPGVEFTGKISETLRPSVEKMGIAVRVIPDSMLQILHDHGKRNERIARKCHLYEKQDLCDNDAAMLSAIRDYAFLGRTDEVLRWLGTFYRRHEGSAGGIKMGLHLAKLLEAANPIHADIIYRQLADSNPASKAILSAYADYLIRSNRMRDIRHIPFGQDGPDEKRPKQEQTDFDCFKALKFFESGEKEKAFQILMDVLERDAQQVFPQSIRFYFLACMKELKGSISSLDSLYDLTGCRRNFTMETIQDWFSISKDLYAQMSKAGYGRESLLILYGITTLGNAWGLL